MNIKNLVAAIALCTALCAAPAAAQPPTPAPASVVGGTAALSVTATSSRVALPADAGAYGALTIYNYGTKDAYIALGSSSVAATTSSIPVRAGTAITIFAWVPGAAVNVPTDVAAICGGADATTLTIYQASGPINLK